MKRLLCLLAIIFLSGCSSINTETEIMRDQFFGQNQKIGMFATQSDSRVIIANVAKGLVCAEPPPETQLTESSSFNLMLEAALKSKEDTAKIQAFRTFSQGLKQLYKRTHTNQLYRDASYYLCQAYINGALTDESINVFLSSLQPVDTTTQAPNNSSAQSQELLQDLKDKKTNIKNSYLLAQLILSNWAFSSLQTEITTFYDAESKLNEGKAAAYAEGLSQLSTDIKEIKASVEKIGSNPINSGSEAGENQEEVETVIEVDPGTATEKAKK